MQVELEILQLHLTHNTIKISLSPNTMQKLQKQIIHEKRHILIKYLKKILELGILHEWATQVLHNSYSSTTILGGGYFEVQFTMNKK